MGQHISKNNKKKETKLSFGDFIGNKRIRGSSNNSDQVTRKSEYTNVLYDNNILSSSYIVRIVIVIRNIKTKRTVSKVVLSEKFETLLESMDHIKSCGLDADFINAEKGQRIIIEKILLFPIYNKNEDFINVSCILKEIYEYNESMKRFLLVENKVFIIIYNKQIDYDIGMSELVSSDYPDIAIEQFDRYTALACGIKSVNDFYKQIDYKYFDQVAMIIQRWWTNNLSLNQSSN